MHANLAVVVHDDGNTIERAVQAQSLDAGAVPNAKSGAMIGATKHFTVRTQHIVAAMIERQVLMRACIDIGRERACRPHDQDREISRAELDGFQAPFANVMGVAQDGTFGRSAAIALPCVGYSYLLQDAFSTPRWI